MHVHLKYFAERTEQIAAKNFIAQDLCTRIGDKYIIIFFTRQSCECESISTL